MKRRTKILHWFYKLSWKKILMLNLLLFLVMVIPISINVALNPTRTRSEAALLPKPQPVTKEFETPTGPPEIYLVDHFFGKPGDAVLVHGENLGGWHKDSWIALSSVKIDLENIVSWTGSYIEFKVPAEAKSGQVEVGILGKKTSWPGAFFVTDEQTEGELRLIVENNQLHLTGKGLVNGRELLVWLLVMSGEGEISLKAMPGVSLTQASLVTPLGNIYEAKIRFSNNELTAGSVLKFIKLVEVVKTGEIQVGIARGELIDNQGGLVPMQSHPLYVSN